MAGAEDSCECKIEAEFLLASFPPQNAIIGAALMLLSVCDSKPKNDLFTINKTHGRLDLRSVLMTEAASTSETLVNFYQTTRRYNPDDSHPHGRFSSKPRPTVVPVFSIVHQTRVPQLVHDCFLPTSLPTHNVLIVIFITSEFNTTPENEAIVFAESKCSPCPLSPNCLWEPSPLPFTITSCLPVKYLRSETGCDTLVHEDVIW
jgi:hypothetical protein